MNIVPFDYWKSQILHIIIGHCPSSYNDQSCVQNSTVRYLPRIYATGIHVFPSVSDPCSLNSDQDPELFDGSGSGSRIRIQVLDDPKLDSFFENLILKRKILYISWPRGFPSSISLGRTPNSV